MLAGVTGGEWGGADSYVGGYYDFAAVKLDANGDEVWRWQVWLGDVPPRKTFKWFGSPRKTIPKLTAVIYEGAYSLVRLITFVFVTCPERPIWFFRRALEMADTNQNGQRQGSACRVPHALGCVTHGITLMARLCLGSVRNYCTDHGSDQPRVLSVIQRCIAQPHCPGPPYPLSWKCPQPVFLTKL